MPDLESYRQQRNTLLKKISETYFRDERIIAAWITGSIARNESDSLSDIDLTLVVADAYSASLCHRLEQVSAQTAPERYRLFSQFGEPALIHENNNNAPEGGTFTFVMYAELAVMIDPFNPVKITKDALRYEVKDYYKSWVTKKELA